MTESDIQSLFFPYGKVKSVRLFRDKGYGFVELTDPSVVDYILQEKVCTCSLTLNLTRNNYLKFSSFLRKEFSLDLIDSITFSGEFIFNARCETGHKWMWKKGNDYRTSRFLLKN